MGRVESTEEAKIRISTSEQFDAIKEILEEKGIPYLKPPKDGEVKFLIITGEIMTCSAIGYTATEMDENEFQKILREETEIDPEVFIQHKGIPKN